MIYSCYNSGLNQPDLGLASVAAIMAISTPTYTNTRVMFRRQRPDLAVKIPLAVGGEEKETEKLQVKGNLCFRGSHTFQSELAIKRRHQTDGPQQHFQTGR